MIVHNYTVAQTHTKRKSTSLYSLTNNKYAHKNEESKWN